MDTVLGRKCFEDRAAQGGALQVFAPAHVNILQPVIIFQGQMFQRAATCNESPQIFGRLKQGLTPCRMTSRVIPM
jgi:hypothetical protein